MPSVEPGNPWPAQIRAVQSLEKSFYADRPRALIQMATGSGKTFTAPGTETLASFVGTVDTILIYESEGLPAVGSLGVFAGQFERANCGVIPQGVPAVDTAFVTAARARVGCIYLTDDNLPNPWDTLPAYFPSLVAALE